jgi:type IV pilus assembly protein PilP
MKLKTTWHILFLFILSLGLSACTDHNMTDLEDFVADVKKKKTHHVGKIPEFPFVESQDYVGFDSNDPFKDFELDKDLKRVKIEEQKTEDPRCIPPDIHRRSEDLEKYPLDTLSMVGVLRKKDNLWALIQDPTNIIHPVEVNNYIGQNFGRIINIDTKTYKVAIMEMHNDGSGCYLEEEATLIMPQEKNL